MTRPQVELLVADDAEAASRAASEFLAEVATSGGHIALCGGSTPRRAYELVAERQPDWSRADVWWGDERCVPPDDEASNFRLVREALLERLAFQPAVVHRIRGELAPAAAAADYERELDGTRLDLVLLGVGADGHTASLFPHAPALAELERLVLAVTDLPLARVTLTLRALADAAAIVFLVTGEDKAPAVRGAFAERPDPAIPASLVRARAGRTVAILDRAAAREL